MTIIDCIIDRPIEVFSLLKKNEKPMLNFSLFEPSFSPLADGDKVKRVDYMDFLCIYL